MTENELLNLVPDHLKDSVKSFRLRGSILTIVADATHLSDNERENAEQLLRGIFMAEPGISAVNVALMADRHAPRIIAIGSGKGGVGKSTLSANVAAALKKSGHKVGLVDADIYGPSQPTLLGTEGIKPDARGNKLVPVMSGIGIPMLSMGHLVEPGKALAWRGPMASNALNQLIDAHWGDTDLLIIDLPPGTGDVQLSMVQKHKPIGAVLVSTPQDLALIDAQRAANLFEVAQVELIGLVENMAGYACPHCGKSSEPFGWGAVEAAAKGAKIPFLGRIPLSQAIYLASDEGTPPALGASGEGAAFQHIADKIAMWLDANASRVQS